MDGQQGRKGDKSGKGAKSRGSRGSMRSGRNSGGKGYSSGGQNNSAVNDTNSPTALATERAPFTIFGEVELTYAEHMQELRSFCKAYNIYENIVKAQKKSNAEFNKVWKEYEHMMMSKAMPVSETITENKMQCLKDWGSFTAYHLQIQNKYKELPLRHEWKRKLVKLVGSKYKLPSVEQIRALNKDRVALEAILVENTELMKLVIRTIEQTASRRMSGCSNALARVDRGQQMLKPEKDWKSLDYAVKQILQDVTHPYMKLSEVAKEGVCRASGAVTIKWETLQGSGNADGPSREPRKMLTDMTKPLSRHEVTGDAASGILLSVQKKCVKKTTRYDEAIGKLAASYQMAILGFLNHLSKKPDAPKRLCIPMLNMESMQLSIDLDPLVNLSCLCMGMARVPMRDYQYTIQLLVPTDNMEEKYKEVLAWKQRLLNVNFMVPSRANLVSAKYASYDWLKNSMQPFDKLQRLMIAFQTLTAAWAAGYYMLGTPFKLKYVPYMIKETWIEKGDVSKKLVADSKFHRTKLLLLPGSFGPDRNVMEVATQCAKNGRKVVAVNAASAYSTGGGCLTGGRHAMEEGWCTQSTLLPSLIHALPLGMATKSTLYDQLAEGLPHWSPDGTKRIFHRHFPEDSVVVSPRVEVFRSPYFDGYQFLQDPVVLQGVVSCAAYNFNKKVTDAPLDAPHGKGKYAEGMRTKLHAVMQAAVKLEGDVLVISDIGTGVFRNNSVQVGTATGEAILQAYGCFKLVVLMGTQTFCDTAARASRVPETSIEGKHVGKKSITRDVVSDCLRLLEDTDNDGSYNATEGAFMDTITIPPEGFPTQPSECQPLREPAGSLASPTSSRMTKRSVLSASPLGIDARIDSYPTDSTSVSQKPRQSENLSKVGSAVSGQPLLQGVESPFDANAL